MFLVGLIVERDLSGDRACSRRHTCDVDLAGSAIIQLRSAAPIAGYRETIGDSDVRNFYLLMMIGWIGGYLGLRWAGLPDDNVAEGERAAEL